jgi:hypothetical protein
MRNILYTFGIRNRGMRSRQTPTFRQWLKNLDYVVAIVIFRNIEKLEKVISQIVSLSEMVFMSRK